MNALFGDATAAMPTPSTQAERGSLMGAGSPGSLDIRQGTPAAGALGVDSAIPGLDIDPPQVTIGSDGKPIYSDALRGRKGTMEEGANRGEGIGGWISRMVSRSRESGSSTRRGTYRPVDQEGD